MSWLLPLLLVLAVAGVAPVHATPDGDGPYVGGACSDTTSWDGFDTDAIDDNTSNDVRVIVRYETDTVRATCGGSAVSAVGGEVVGGQDIDLVPMVVARVDPAAMDALENRPEIAAVERDAMGAVVGSTSSAYDQTDGETTADDGAIAPSATTDEDESGGALSQQVPWGIQRVGGVAAADAISDSAMGDVQVAVLDTGIDLDHPDIGDNVVWGANLTQDVELVGREHGDDVGGHGTHVAGTIAAQDNGVGVVGMAPNVSLYSMKVLNGDGTGRYSWWIRGVELAIEGPDGTIGTADDADVISMSLGGSESSTQLRSILQEANEEALLVAASGNNGNGIDTVLYPAAYPETLAVAATTDDDLRAGYSSSGPEVDIAAPGGDSSNRVLSTFPPEFAGGNEYASLTGTSMATPHVSGAAALLIAEDLADGSEDSSSASLRDRLTTAALDIHSDGVDDLSGHGRLRTVEALNTTVEDDPPVASFTVSPTEPVVNETLRLDASPSTDDRGIASYNWTIDGSQVNNTDPVETGRFVDAGTFDISLTVLDTAGQTNTTSRTITVQPDEPPTARFTFDPDEPFVNETVTLDGRNATDDLGIVAYNWTVGQTNLGFNDSRAGFTSSEPGTYPIRLTVRDAAGQTDTATQNVTIQADDPPVAAFSVTPETPVTNRSTLLNASASTDDRAIASYNWTIDGSPVVTTNATLDRPFSTPGSHTVSLTVVDSAGQSNTTTQNLTVTAPLVLADPTVDSPVRVNNSTTVSTAVSVGDIVPGQSADAPLTLDVRLNGTTLNTTTVMVSEGATTNLSISVTPTETGTLSLTLVANVSFDGTAFETTSAASALQVGPESGPLPLSAPITGESMAATLDDDALLEDINGDGDGDIFDAIAYFNNRHSDAIVDRPARFDFNGNGEAGDIGDAVALYNEVTSETTSSSG